jgi:hypothetical protein
MTKERRRKINWKWINLMCLAAPLLSFVFIKQDWLARLIAVNGVNVVISIIVLNYGLNPKCHILGTRGYFAVHKVSDEKKKRIEFFWRIPTTIFGIAMLWFVMRPLIADDIQFAHQGSTYAKHVEGRVANNETMYAAYFLFQGLRINEDGQQSEHSYTALFCNRIARLGRTYSFIIAPKSGLVLDFQEIPDANNSINKPE